MPRHFLSTAFETVDKQRILYAGNLGRVQGLDVAVRAFARIASEKAFVGWTLEFIGGGVLTDELKALATSLGMQDRILFHAPVGKDAVMQELGRSALLLINLKNDKVFELTIPSKVFDYMSAGRPILFGITGEGREILKSTGANMEFTPSKEDLLANVMQQAFGRMDELTILAKRNPGFVDGLYSREANTNKLMGIFDKLTERGKWKYSSPAAAASSEQDS